MHLQRGLQRNRVAGDEQRVEQGRQILVDLPGGGDVARLDQLDHLADLRADQVTRDGDDPDRTQAHVAERRPVVPAVHLEVRWRLGHQSGHALEITGRVLHRDDVGPLGELQERLVFDARRCPAGDVVDDDRELGCVGHALEVRDQPALRRLVVVRRHDEQPIGARVLRGLRQLERLGGRVRPGAADQLAAAFRDLADRAEELGLLLVRERRRLARGTGDHDRVAAGVEQVRCQALRAVDVQRVTLLAERRDHRRDERSEPAGHASSFATGRWTQTALC